MHVQIVNFRLTGIGESDDVALCDELAPAFAALPGLQSKVWLADHEGGVYGGVYVWESEEAMHAFARSELFAGLLAHENLTDITSLDFEVLAGPTAATSRLKTTTA